MGGREGRIQSYTQLKQERCHGKSLPALHHLLVDYVHLQRKPPAVDGVLRAPVEVKLHWPVLSPQISSSQYRHPPLVFLLELQLLNKMEIKNFALTS